MNEEVRYLFCAFLLRASRMNPGTWEILYLLIPFYTTLAASSTTNFLMSAFERTLELLMNVQDNFVVYYYFCIRYYQDCHYSGT